MSARITISAVVVSICGLLFNTAAAQSEPTYPVVPAGFTSCDSQCADATLVGCTEPASCNSAGCDGIGCDGGCDSYGRAAGWLDGCQDLLSGCGDWLSVKRFARQHGPRCRCMRCRLRPMWASFDALLWWGKSRTIPALATGGPTGVLPDSSILFGNDSVGNGLAPGARVDFGMWFDQCESLGAGAKFWGLYGDRADYSADSATEAVLGRPFYNVLSDAPDAVLVSSPGLLSGQLDITTYTNVLAGEAYLRSSLLAGCGYDIDFMGGYHFARLDDEISIESNSVVENIAVGAPVGTQINVLDSFDARNEFHGGEIGLISEIRHGKWAMTSLAKVSVGNMRQSITIDGQQTNTIPAGTPSVTQGGVLALPTNIGTYERDVTAWIPEFGFTAAYQVRPWMRMTMGYSAIWFSDVAFAGQAIDPMVNPSQFTGGVLIGPPQPQFTGFQSTEYWLHGMNLGLTVTF